MNRFPPAPPVLSFNQVRLEPLAPEHEAGLIAAVRDGELWKLAVTTAPAPEQVAAYIQTALSTRTAFAVIDECSGKIVGTTAFYDTDPDVPRLYIGYTWYAQSAQRTRINTSCKILLLDYAFDTLNCQAVGWHTDILNTASQRAIERLGAQRDGILRRDRKRKDGSLRDTVVYSLLREEWPSAKSALLSRLHAYSETGDIAVQS
ncbi:GNAT family N-acetyltransferase [Neisseria animalis]|uniref:N-acetyltransferase n=1 Tax=Neisseria animalis TaxID=492 RepID=A0A5P3MQB9_NEIAN|nr:GNAT family protein [Neisseria animalis]QEY23773.1 N-acetyltransferase [Neisseria animalis]ROW31638.1 N-acetyltransferase [Neisseria animalis]